MKGRIAILVLACATAACGRLSNAANVPPLRRYSEVLVATSGAKLSLARCAMFGESRKGYCVLSGPAAEVSGFTKGLKLASSPAGAVFGDQSCLMFGDFGAPDGAGFRAKAGVTRLVAGGPLPGNTDNVHFVAAYAASGSLCLELEYPYG